jgi:hypothetical protein
VASGQIRPGQIKVSDVVTQDLIAAAHGKT